jgi:hypothetical protein
MGDDMKRLLTGSLLVALLALVAFVGNAAATEYIYVHNASGSAINKGCPVGTDTGTVAMVTAVHVGADTTTTLTLLSKLHAIALPAVPASRAYWTVKARFNTAATDTFTRTLRVFGRDVAGGLHNWSFAFDTSDIGTYVIPWNIAKVESAKFTGKATTDTIHMYAEAFYSVTGITATTAWTHPFIGVAAETILAQNRGRVAVLGEAPVYLSAAAKPGYVIYPGTAVTAMGAAFATPDSGSFIGFVRVPTTAAGFATAYIVPQYMGVPSALTYAGNITTGVNLTVQGNTWLGDSSYGDTIGIYSQFLTWDGSSNWVNIVNPTLLKRPSSFGHVGTRLYGTGGTGGYFNSLFVNTILDTATASCDVRGAEIKGTSEVSATGTAKLSGLYAKAEIKGTSKTCPWASAVYSIIDIASGCTGSSVYNFYAEHANSGTATASAILGCKAGTWKYGIDLTNGIFSTADILMPGGATVSNPASPGTTYTITETNIALAGAATATTLAVGSGGTVMTKIVASGADSLGFIVAGDTFWAFSGGVK